MEIEYARRVKAKGWSHNLVQRATRDYGHRAITPTDLVQSFNALTDWVKGGVKPAGDNVLDPAEEAAPDFGCKWTDKVTRRQWGTVPALAFVKPPACPAP